MDTAQKILLTVGLSTDEFDKKIISSQDKLAGLTQARKDLQKALDEKLKSGEIEKGSAAYLEMRKSINQASAEARVQKKVLAELEKQQANLITTTQEQQGSNQQMKASLSLLTSEYNRMGDAEKESTAKGKLLKLSISEITETLKANESAVGDNRRNVGNYTESLKKVLDTLNLENVAISKSTAEYNKQKTSIGFLKDKYGSVEEGLKHINAQVELNNQKYQANLEVVNHVTHNIQDLTNKQQELDDSTANTTDEMGLLITKIETLREKLKDPTGLSKEEFADLNEELRQSQLEFDQASGKVDEFGNKEAKNPAKKAYEDAAEAAAGLTSAITLAGLAFGESENLQEVQAKATMAVAIATNVQNVAKSVGGIIDTKNNIIKKSSIALEKIHAQVIGKSTGAAKGFKLALAATGIGAILILLGELIFNWDGVNKVINKSINWFGDFTTKISGNSKILKGIFTALAAIILGPIAPLILIIKLIDDFGGTITQLQGFVNGIIDEIGSFTDKLGPLGKHLRIVQGLFNFVTNGIKNLDKTQGQFKVDLETLTKVYEEHNKEIEKNKKQIDDQIRLARAQGKSEKDLAALTRKSLQQTMKDREVSYQQAVEIAARLKKQNGQLTDDQKKLFEQAEADYNNSQLDISVFEAEQIRERNEKFKEAAEKRKGILEAIVKNQMDNNIRLRQIQIDSIADEQEREQAALRFGIEQELAAITEGVKNLEGTEAQKAAAIDEANKLKQAILSKYYTDATAIDDKFKEQQRLKDEADYAESFAGQAKAISDQLAMDQAYAEATIEDAKKLEEEKLKIKLKSLQDQLALARSFFEKDKVLTQEELDALADIEKIVNATSAKLTEMQNQPKMIDGLGMTEEDLSAIQSAAGQITAILDTISTVINAVADSRKQAIDDNYNREKAAIENSTLDQEAKEEKIQELNKKTAMDKYKIELEQFEANKALSIITATINTALAVMNAIATVPFPGNIAAAILAGVTGAVQIGIIASAAPPAKPQFFDGGFTEGGNPREKSRYSNSKYDLHKGEFVTANRVLQRPEAWPHVQALAAMHTETPGSLNLAGFADGGFTAREMASSALDGFNLQTAIGNEMGKQLKKFTVVAKFSDLTRLAAENANTNVEANLI
jgi:hypothetical protein